MQLQTIISTILLAALLVTGFATAAIPTPSDGQITDSVTHANSIKKPDMTAIGTWNNQAWGSGETLICSELNGHRVCYHGKPVPARMSVNKISRSDVPDNLLALLTALKNSTN